MSYEQTFTFFLEVFTNFGNFRERGAIENENEYDHAARGIHAEQSIGPDACCSVRFDLACRMSFSHAS